jgi:hypothetical protein
VRWTQLAVRLPDDGSGALPLLRQIILNDDKFSTYKLALLRALCRIADGAAGYARDVSEEHIAVPLGLVALYWVRLFKPLLAADLPQSPTNRGYEGLGFVKEGFKRLTDISHLDLRVGSTFGEDRSAAIHYALRDSCETITRMPAHHMTYPNGGPVLLSERARHVARPNKIRLDGDYLSGFGELLVPRHLWQALRRFDAWVEPALVSEWFRLMKLYATSQGRTPSTEDTSKAMTWSDPDRDVRLAREQALHILGHSKLHCAWTGRLLTVSTLDVDHCLPWAAWPCDDLWNLLPAHRSVNRNQKREKLPSDSLLRSSQERIQSWWQAAYLKADNEALHERFKVEARATLTTISASEFRLDDVFDGVTLQRLRLKHDQQIPEWVA